MQDAIITFFYNITVASQAGCNYYFLVQQNRDQPGRMQLLFFTSTKPWPARQDAIITLFSTTKPLHSQARCNDYLFVQNKRRQPDRMQLLLFRAA